MTRGTVVALVGLWVHLLGAASLGAQVSVQELEVHLQLRRDTVALTQVIPVRNDEDRAQQVRLSVGDWYRDSLGNNQFVEPGTTPGTCGERLRVFPMTFQVAAHATELVRVSYAPAPADSGCWSIVFVETVTPPPAKPDAEGSFLTLEIRTGVKVYVHRREARRDGIVEDADVSLVWRLKDPDTGSRDTVQVREVAVRFANTGTAHIRVKGSVEIRDREGALLHTIEGGEAPMTPGSVRWISIRLPTLPAGEYIAVALLDYGGHEIAAAQIEFRVP